jgi:drug/metabolite transporter (DMT)-like permease
LAHFALPDERLTWRKGTGVILALSGALLLALRGESGLPDVSRASQIGYILVFIAITCGSGMTIYTRKFMRDLNSIEVSSIRMFVATLAIVPLSVIIVGLDLKNVTGQGYVALLYAALVGTFGAFLLAFYNVKRFGATTAAMVLYITPITAAIAGVIVLGERITAGMLVGTFLIVIGIATINQRAPSVARHE